MKPFTAPISDRSRELYGRYMPRYESIPSMRPFNADISDRRRELFGEYMRRYETVSSMQPFDADLGDRSRHLYGDYRSRWSALKTVGQSGGGAMGADGTNWVDWVPTPADTLKPEIFDHSIYQIRTTLYGGWAGSGIYRILLEDSGTVIYPFELSATLVSGSWLSLGTLSSRIRVGDQAVVQIRSTNAGDQGPAQQFVTQIRYAIWDESV